MENTMVIDVLNKGEILIPDEYLPEDYINRKSSTSYLNEFKIKNGQIKLDSDFLYRLICYNNIRKYIDDKYETNLDIFGGVGITAKLFSKKDKLTYVNDIDENCLYVLNKNFENVLNEDVNDFSSDKKFDVILADFNDFTIKKFIDKGYDHVLQNIVDYSDKYVIVNDCSVFYLKFGENSFKNYSNLLGSKVGTIEEFFNEESKFISRKLKGWKVRHIEYFSNSSFLLLEKSNRDLIPTLHKVQNNKEKIIDIHYEKL